MSSPRTSDNTQRVNPGTEGPTDDNTPHDRLITSPTSDNYLVNRFQESPLLQLSMPNPFSSIPNPAAAAKAIQDFQKDFNAKQCMVGNEHCSKKIIAAHTLSKEAMLRPISVDGHVYTLANNLYNSMAGQPMDFKRMGISDTSVFNGFCSTHDKDLFRCFEDEPFGCTHEQLFMIAYRSVAKETYLKAKQANSMLSPEVVKTIHGIDESVDVQYSSEATWFVEASLRGYEDLKAVFERLENARSSCDWQMLRHTVVPFKNRPIIAATFPFPPQYDFDDHVLQDFEDFSRDLDPLIVTLTPMSSGGYEGFLIFSYFRDLTAVADAFIKSFLDQQNLADAAVHLILLHSENYACNPVWFESLTEQELSLISSRVAANADFTSDIHVKLSDEPIRIDDWSPDAHFGL